MKKSLETFFTLYFGGMAAGIICVNLIQKYYGYQTGFLGYYMAGRAVEHPSAQSLFFNVLQTRALFWVFNFLSGMTPFGIIIATAVSLWLGFLAGNLFTVFLMEYGVRGIFYCTASFFPQILFYAPAVFLTYLFVQMMSQKFWSGRRPVKEDYKAYGFFFSVIGVLLLTGVFTECYVNVRVIDYVSKHLF